MAELTVGDAALLATDVGPLIDAQAHAHIARHIERNHRHQPEGTDTLLDFDVR